MMMILLYWGECASHTCSLLRGQVGDLGTLLTTRASAATAGASEEGCEVEAKVAVAAEVVDEVVFPVLSLRWWIWAPFTVLLLFF